MMPLFPVLRANTIVQGGTKVERAEAYNLVKKHIKNKNLIKHMLATEAVMGGLAKRCAANVEMWRLAGLVHDLDYDQTAEQPEQHGLLAAKMLQELAFPQKLSKQSAHTMDYWVMSGLAAWTRRSTPPTRSPA